MNDFRLHKRKLVVNLSIFLILAIASVFLIIGAGSAFSKQGIVLLLLFVVLVQIPVILSLFLTSIRIIATAINENKENKILQEVELDNYEKEVEEKVKEADDLTFNLNRLNEEVGKQESWELFGQALLQAISKQIEITVGMVYALNKEEDTYKAVANYAYYSDQKPNDFKSGEGLSGQVVKDNRAIFLSEIPENYIEVISGLGQSKPNHLVILPIFKNSNVIGVVELATFKPIGESFERRVNDISESFGNLAPMI